MRYFLGVDGGGTKARYALANQQGEILCRHKARGLARTTESTAAIVAQLRADITRCLAEGPVELSGITALCFGLPFFGELAEKDRQIADALQSEFSCARCLVTNDSEVGWAGSLAFQPGVNIVAGTGAIAYGRNAAGQATRSGGWAPFFGDEGSCYWLGRKAMELFSKQADGRLPQGALYDIVREHFNLENDFDFIELMEEDYIPTRSKVAGLQVLLDQAAAEGDRSAALIYEEGVNELALCVTTVADQLELRGQSFPVSYSGGLFKPFNRSQAAVAAKEKLVITPLRERVEAIGGVLQKPLLKPYHGALLCAINAACPEFLEDAAATMIKEFAG